MSPSPAPRSPARHPPPHPQQGSQSQGLTLPWTAVPGRGAGPESPGGQSGEPGPGRPAHPEHRYLHVGLVLETRLQARPGSDAYMCLSSEAGSCFCTEQTGKLRHRAARSLCTTTQLCALCVKPPDQAWPADVSLKPNPHVGNSARGGQDVQVGFSPWAPADPSWAFWASAASGHAELLGEPRVGPLRPRPHGWWDSGWSTDNPSLGRPCSGGSRFHSSSASRPFPLPSPGTLTLSPNAPHRSTSWDPEGAAWRVHLGTAPRGFLTLFPHC